MPNVKCILTDYKHVRLPINGCMEDLGRKEGCENVNRRQLIGKSILEIEVKDIDVLQNIVSGYN